MHTGTPEQSPTGPAPSPDGVLDVVWSHQRQWSAAADAGRRRVERARLGNLVLLVLGALAGALAAQTGPDSATATGAAAVAAVALALAGLLQAHALTTGQTARWTRARAASEALKAEVHRYLLRVAPYAGPDRSRVLQARLDEVRARAAGSLVDRQQAPADGRPLPALRTVREYVDLRARGQAAWHRERSAAHARRACRLRTAQLAATGTGAVLAALAGTVPSWGLSAWTAAATTVATAVGAHLAATRYQGVAAASAGTADRLEALVAGFDLAAATPEQEAHLVTEVERVLAAQNEGWADLFGDGPA
ncbi:Protein of unknown function [Geodermatophilus telluris]|uniref:SMODS and SLOG-associating 2TM effector domain-containing protein n=1 Tax=Geodermatophilus telluris TaxID=1190417 RepID=A0A1G6V4K6_9ACTN|nr:DUF4231 domain-containing protein [Geodermatophilus telluris]SDD47816.1 Protein of unknown function [Geodermatophilus telluris]